MAAGALPRPHMSGRGVQWTTGSKIRKEINQTIRPLNRQSQPSDICGTRDTKNWSHKIQRLCLDLFAAHPVVG